MELYSLYGNSISFVNEIFFIYRRGRRGRRGVISEIKRERDFYLFQPLDHSFMCIEFYSLSGNSISFVNEIFFIYRRGRRGRRGVISEIKRERDFYLFQPLDHSFMCIEFYSLSGNSISFVNEIFFIYRRGRRGRRGVI